MHTTIPTFFPCVLTPQILDALDGAVLTQGEFEALSILLDPRNDDDQNEANPATIEDQLELFSDYSSFWASHTNDIGNRLRSHYERLTGNSSAFFLEFSCDPDGYINGYQVMTSVGSAGSWMISNCELKYIDPDRYNWSGLMASVRVAEVLINDYEQARHTVDELRMSFVDELNRAADDIIELVDGDERVTDAVNLLVNAAQHYVQNPESGLKDVVEANFESGDDIIDRLRDI